ncbi:MAG: hypothetical protein ABIH22_02540 [Candidatus Margulisiibacteriota bacterium]
MNEQVDKRNYDVASISQVGREKRANHVRHANIFDSSKLKISGNFIDILSNKFLSKKRGPRALV